MNTSTRSAFPKSSRGFTLTEVLVATLVFTTIMIAALMIYDRSNRVFKTSVEAGDMQQNTRAAFDRLVTDVRMAGFDYDRDGVPSRSAAGLWAPSTNYALNAVAAPVIANGFAYQVIAAGTTGASEPSWPTTAGATLNNDGTVSWRALGPVFQQADEQIEYAGRSAIVVRANYDYNTDAANQNGREFAYEPLGGQFPVVTTGNDEIVIYALRSNAGSNGTLTFYADVTRPRSVYPNGSAETQVSIPNVDLCASGCNSPPYTLLRFTLGNDGSPDSGTVVATNVRDLQFNYYTDISGTTLLTQADGTAITNGAIGGDGQFDPANLATTNFDQRTQRAAIAAIAVQLVGMSSAPDGRYTNPNESVVSAQHYRQYTLRSNVTPRNMGLSGMEEPSGDPPGPATMTSVCAGHCKVTRVAWAPPVTGNVLTYEVHYDTSATGSFANVAIVVPGDVTSAPVMNLSPGTTYYFKVVAVNENGESTSSNALGRTPLNTTQPSPVTDLVATAGAGAQANQITLTWTAPATNVSPLNTLSCAGTSVSGSAIDPAEPIRYRIWRGTTADFATASGTLVLDSGSATQPTGTPGTQITWVDDLNNLTTRPPANCKEYWYRIQVYDTCSIDAATAASWNSPAVMATGLSTTFPDPTASPAADGIEGYASSTVLPSAPGQPSVNYTNNNSQCSREQNRCDVKIVWPAVTTDTSNPTATITVNEYRLKRERKKAGDAAWVFDTYLPVLEDASSDAANMEGTNVVYHDTSAVDHDGTDRRKWYYRYTVYALQCGVESAPSPTVEFPQSCGLVNSTVIVAGESGGNGTLASPWILNATDSLRVIPPADVALNRVEFEVWPEPDEGDPHPLDRRNANNSPFVYSWNDQADGAVYRVLISMTNDQGCTEETERFVQDDPINCPSATISQTGASSGAGTIDSPWVMGASDLITINQPSNGTIASVVFALTDSDGNAVGSSITDASAPFTYSWSSQTDNAVYTLTSAVTFVEGCEQTVERSIRDEASPVCSGATASATGEISGNDGTTQALPWLLNGGDSITINAPAGGSINQVAFVVTPVSPAGGAFAPMTDSTAPFTITWNDQTDNTVYSVVATITYSTGCTETVTRYVKDQVCSGATTTAIGSSGAGTGNTNTSPWVFNGGDYIDVNPPAGATPASVVFTLKQGATTISTLTDSASPFRFTWTDLVDNTAYTLTIAVTYSTGCSETFDRFIRDQGGCFISVGAPTVSTVASGARKIATITFTISNPAAETLTIQGFKLDWARDAAHPGAVLDNVVYNGSTQAIPSANEAPTTTGVLAPSPAVGTVPASSSSYTLAFKWDIGKKTDVSDLASSWVSGLCVRYSSASLGTTVSCNVMGSTSNNPNSCN